MLAPADQAKRPNHSTDNAPAATANTAASAANSALTSVFRLSSTYFAFSS